MSVSMRFLDELDTLPNKLKPSIAQYMAHIHSSVNDISKVYFENLHYNHYHSSMCFLIGFDFATFNAIFQIRSTFKMIVDTTIRPQSRFLS